MISLFSIAVALFIFILGTLVGSFLNVLILRHKTGLSVFSGRSRCFSCGRELTWYELIPVISFCVQKGRCRRCGSKISSQYALVEVTTGIVFATLFFKIAGLSFFALLSLSTALLGTFLFYCVVFCLLIVLSVYDIRHLIIPDLYVFSFVGVVAVARIVSIWLGVPFSAGVTPFIQSIVAGALAFGFFFLLWFFSKGRAMGFGDAKLAFGMGILLGPELMLWATVYAFWAGALVGIVLLFLRHRSFTMKSEVPFGPFLALGTFFAFICGAIFLL